MVLENEDLLKQLGPIRDNNATELENLILKMNDKAIIQAIIHAIANMLIQKSAAEIHIMSKKDVNIFAFYINNYILNVKNFSLIYY